ncbi:hypothetical protein [Changping earthworm virus 1]|uniref:hypothetical protein n=1 Tax=Changping earthworm virus 1 TaxID=1922826 RepID=UPI00090BBAEA|nr:hypothetical protein [Changping earthworm virus 1]APG77912.1 hypothetical protein [Changping earthworm virus 1]
MPKRTCVKNQVASAFTHCTTRIQSLLESEVPAWCGCTASPTTVTTGIGGCPQNRKFLISIMATTTCTENFSCQTREEFIASHVADLRKRSRPQVPQAPKECLPIKKRKTCCNGGALYHPCDFSQMPIYPESLRPKRFGRIHGRDSTIYPIELTQGGRVQPTYEKSDGSANHIVKLLKDRQIQTTKIESLCSCVSTGVSCPGVYSADEIRLRFSQTKMKHEFLVLINSLSYLMRTEAEEEFVYFGAITSHRKVVHLMDTICYFLKEMTDLCMKFVKNFPNSKFRSRSYPVGRPFYAEPEFDDVNEYEIGGGRAFYSYATNAESLRYTCECVSQPGDDCEVKTGFQEWQRVCKKFTGHLVNAEIALDALLQCTQHAHCACGKFFCLDATTTLSSLFHLLDAVNYRIVATMNSLKYLLSAFNKPIVIKQYNFPYRNIRQIFDDHDCLANHGLTRHETPDEPTELDLRYFKVLDWARRMPAVYYDDSDLEMELRWVQEDLVADQVVPNMVLQAGDETTEKPDEGKQPAATSPTDGLTTTAKEVAGPAKVDPVAKSTADNEVTGTTKQPGPVCSKTDVSCSPNKVTFEKALKVAPSMDTIFGREYYLDSFPWAIGAGPGTIIFRLTLPNELFTLLDSAMKAIVEYHLYARYQIELRVVANPTPFHAGALRVWVDPSQTVATPLSATTIRPHVTLNLGFANEAVISVPFLEPRVFLEKPKINSAAFNTTVWAQVFNTLRTGAATTQSVSVGVYARFREITVGPKDLPSILQGGDTHGSVLDEVLEHIPIVSDLVGAIGGFSPNHDSPSVTKHDSANLAVVDVPRVVNKLFFKKDDRPQPCEFRPITHNFLITAPYRLLVVPWTAAHAKKTNIMNFRTNINVTAGANFITNSPLVNIARHTTYYRGQLDFIVEIIATKSHQGRLMLVYSPYSNDPLTFDAARTLPSYTMDIQETNRVRIRVPFIYHQEAKETAQRAYGFLNAFVQIPLTHPDMVANQVEFNIYYCGAPDLKLYVPGKSALTVEGGLNRVCKKKVDESSCTDKDDEILWEPFGDSVTNPIDYMSSVTIYDLLRRPVKIFPKTEIPELAQPVRLFRLPIAPVHVVTGGTASTLDIWPFQAYLRSGSSRYIFHSDCEKATKAKIYFYLTRIRSVEVVPGVPSHNALYIDDGSAAMPFNTTREALAIWQPQQSPTFEIEIPHYGNNSKLYLHTETYDYVNNDAVFPQVEVYVEQKIFNGVGFNLELFWADGDDAKYMIPVAPEAFTLNDDVPIPTIVEFKETAKKNAPILTADRYEEVMKGIWSNSKEMKLEAGDQGSIMTNIYDFFTGIKSFFFALKDKALNNFASVRDGIKAKWDTLKTNFSTLSSTIDLAHKVMYWSIRFLAFLLPAICTLFTIHKGGLAMRCVGVLCFTTLVSSFLDGDSENFSDSLNSLLLEDGDDLEEVDSETGKTILDSIHKCVAKVLESLSCIGGEKYHKYMRRVVAEKENTFSYFGTYLIETVKYLFLGNSLNEQYDYEKKTELVDLHSKFNAHLAAGHFVGTALDDVYNGKTGYEHLLEIHRKTQAIKKEAADVTYPPFLAACLNDVEKTYCEVQRKRRICCAQAEPVGILIAGTPGIGKSFVMSDRLPKAVLGEAGLLKTDYKRQIYNIPCGEHKFMDNYNQQPYVYFDDFLQDKDGADQSLMIRMISTGKMPVNMASLNEKGIEYKSPFVAVSTNQTNLNLVQQIHEKTALVRRFKFAYVMELKDEYASISHVGIRTLNMTKLVSDLKGKSTEAVSVILDRVWSFTPLDLIRGEKVQNSVRHTFVYTFSQIVHQISLEYAERQVNFAELGQLQAGDDPAVLDVKPSGSGLPPPAEDLNSLWEDDSEAGSESEFTEPQGKLAVANNNFDYEMYEFWKPSSLEYISPVFESSLADIVREHHSSGKNDAVATMKLLHYCMKHYMSDSDYKDFVAASKTDHNPYTLYSQYFTGVNHQVLEQIDSIHQCAGKQNAHSKKRNQFLGFLAILASLGLASGVLYVSAKAIIERLHFLKPILQGYSSGKPKVAKAAKTVTAVQTLASLLQGGDIEDEKFEKIRRNIRVITYIKNDGVRGREHGIFVDDRTLLVPYHTFKNVVTARYCDINNEIQHLAVEHNLQQITDSDFYRDCAVLYLSHRPASGIRNIKHFFFPDFPKFREYLSNRKERIGLLLNEESTIEGSVPVVAELECVEQFTHPDMPRCHYLGGAISQDGNGCHVGLTQSGDCGRPYVSGRGTEFPILGIHSMRQANGMTIGFAPVTQQGITKAVNEIVERCGLQLKPHIEYELQGLETSPIEWAEWYTENLHVGRLHNIDLVVHSSDKTNYVPYTVGGRNFFHPEWECDHKPVRTHYGNYGGETFYPPARAAQKYSSAAYVAIGNVTYQTVLQHYLTKFPKGIGGKTTMFDAINGNDNGLEPLNMKTGCGYLAHYGWKKGKTQFFDQLPTPVDCRQIYGFSDKANTCRIQILGNKTFTEHLDYCDEEIQNARTFTHLWVSTTKDELRHEDKVEKGKVRIFEQPSLEYVLLFRKYFGDFLGWYKQRPGFKFYHGIGIDKEAVWGHFAQGFLSVGSEAHAFDYSNWDGSVAPEGFEFFLDVTDHFYGSDTAERNARHTLVRMLRDSYHIFGGRLYRTTQGNKSGNPATDVFNSIVNSFVMMTTFVTCQKLDQRQADLSEFDEKVRMLTYGDDLALAVRPDVAGYFHGKQIAALTEVMGYKITSADKKSEIPKTIPFEEVTFLKTPFVYSEEDDLWLAPLPECEIYKELKYAPKNVIGDLNDLKQRVKVTQRFFAHHGKKRFQKFQNELREMGIPSSWLDYRGAIIADIREKQRQAVIT